MSEAKFEAAFKKGDTDGSGDLGKRFLTFFYKNQFFYKIFLNKILICLKKESF